MLSKNIKSDHMTVVHVSVVFDVGLGLSAPGDVTISLGTSTTMFGIASQPRPSPTGLRAEIISAVPINPTDADQNVVGLTLVPFSS